MMLRFQRVGPGISRLYCQKSALSAVAREGETGAASRSATVILLPGQHHKLTLFNQLSRLATEYCVGARDIGCPDVINSSVGRPRTPRSLASS